MKIYLFILMTFSALILRAENLKPYILGAESSGDMASTRSTVKASLVKNGLEVVGEYKPANDASRYLFIVTSSDLKNAVKKKGGLTGFAATLRVGLTREGGKTIITYTNPKYWGNAYFRSDFPDVASYYTSFEGKLEKSMRDCGTYKGTAFGSEKGIAIEDLRKYHYMFGMPYFDDTEELEDFDSHKEAVAKIESALSKGVSNVKKVYKVAVPGTELVLYGFALSGEDGEGKFLPVIDISNPKHTCFLPYEVLVMGKEVHMLHGRYRIALSFPDLTMGTFTKIMSTPGDIEDLLEQLVE